MELRGAPDDVFGWVKPKIFDGEPVETLLDTSGRVRAMTSTTKVKPTLDNGLF